MYTKQRHLFLTAYAWIRYRGEREGGILFLSLFFSFSKNPCLGKDQAAMRGNAVGHLGCVRLCAECAGLVGWARTNKVRSPISPDGQAWRELAHLGLEMRDGEWFGMGGGVF